METGGIAPRPEVSLLFFDNRVSADNNVKEWGILFLSLFVTLEPAGVLVTNGDGVSEIFRRAPVNHVVNLYSWSVFNIRVAHQILGEFLFFFPDRWW